MASCSVLWMASIFLFLGACILTCYGSAEEDRLIKKLLENYNEFARPNKDESEAVEVEYGLSMLQIIKFDYNTQTLTTDMWENFLWQDKRLSWKVTEGGPESIVLPPDMIWMPDVQPYNGWKIRRDMTNVVIYSIGLCSWVPRMVLESSCSSNSQIPEECTIKVGSWTYDGTKLNLTNRASEIDLSNYMPNPAYDLVQTSSKRSVKSYECCPEPYIDITFTIVLKERE